MMLIIFAIFTAIGIMLMSFLTFSPNLSAILKTDFERTINNNLNTYAIERGQLAVRSGELAPGGSFRVPKECYYSSGRRVILHDSENVLVAPRYNPLSTLPSECSQVFSFEVRADNNHKITVKRIN